MARSPRVQTRGWSSPKFCSYPQEIIFELDHGPAAIENVKVLSHQYKIARRVDLYVGNGPDGADYRSCAYDKLGFFCFDPNERSDFKVGTVCGDARAGWWRTGYVSGVGKLKSGPTQKLTVGVWLMWWEPAPAVCRWRVSVYACRAALLAGSRN